MFNNKPGAVVLILLFVAAYLWSRNAEAEELTGAFELGATITSAEFNGGYGLVYTERVADVWDIGLQLMSDQQFEDKDIGNNGGFMVQRIVERGKWEMGLGGSYWIETSNVIGCHTAFAMNIKYKFSRNWHASWRHWSNAGICEHNKGQDLLTIGWRF